jgi:hypothetical protein
MKKPTVRCKNLRQTDAAGTRSAGERAGPCFLKRAVSRLDTDELEETEENETIGNSSLALRLRSELALD